MKRCAALFVLLCCSACVTIQIVEDPCERALRDPARRNAFLQEMPKGADLHSHVQGAVYAEDLLAHADDSYWLDKGTMQVTKTQSATTSPLMQTWKDGARRTLILSAWSTHGYSGNNGHDHFFNAFDRFKILTAAYKDEIIVDVLKRAMAQNVSYVELMVNPHNDETRRITGKMDEKAEVKSIEEFEALRKDLINQGFLKHVEALRSDIDKTEAALSGSLGFDPLQVTAETPIAVRFLFQVPRCRKSPTVFALLLLAFHLSQHDQRFVGVNLVGPEDAEIALKDYQTHMLMLRYLANIYPGVKITLHAGEVTDALADSKRTVFHVREALQVPNVKRIGHGVNIKQDPEYKKLMHQMATTPVLLEAPLSSNDFILGAKGESHPLSEYLVQGVPVALATDDEGILRVDMSTQFIKAVLEQHFSYSELKRAVRNSLEFSFLEGPSLWKNPAYDRRVDACQDEDLCKSFIEANPRAIMQWKLERDLETFEKNACR